MDMKGNGINKKAKNVFGNVLSWGWPTLFYSCFDER
jgi:hypothetical protein